MKLTGFQSSILSEVASAGSLRFIPAGVAAKHNLSVYKVNKELSELVDGGLIIKENKLTYINGKYRSIVFLNVKT